MYRRVVVPLDGSDNAEIALAEAEGMATLMGVPIHLVRVLDMAESTLYVDEGQIVDWSDTSTLVVDEVEAVRQYLDAVASRLGEQGCRVRHELRCGPVVAELIAAARPGDLYVMASHGRTGLSRWFLGSVAEEVVRRSQAPVLLIRSTHSARTSIRWSPANHRTVVSPGQSVSNHPQVPGSVQPG